MADFVPANIIQTPDFGAIAQNSLTKKRQDDAAMNSFIDQRQKKQGLYLEGDKPAVQDAWNKYQIELDTATDSGSPEAKRRADMVYGEYSQIAGAAQANASQYRGEVASFKTDPSKFSISGNEFLSVSDDFSRTRRSSDEILEAVNNPFTLSRSMKYDLANPVTQAQKMFNMGSAKLQEFTSADGSVNRAALRNWANDMASAMITANETSLEKAMAWGGIQEGYVGGEEGIINSMEELEFLRNQPDEKKKLFVDKYAKELVNDYMNLIPNKFETKSTGEGYLELESYRVDREGATSTTDASPLSYDFKAFSKPFTGSMKNILGFSYDTNGNIILQETYEVEEFGKKGKEKVLKTRIRDAKPNEVARIKNTLKKDYGLSISEKPVSSQQENKEALKGKDSLGILD